MFVCRNYASSILALVIEPSSNPLQFMSMEMTRFVDVSIKTSFVSRFGMKVTPSIFLFLVFIWIASLTFLIVICRVQNEMLVELKSQADRRGFADWIYGEADSNGVSHAVGWKWREGVCVWPDSYRNLPLEYNALRHEAVNRGLAEWYSEVPGTQPDKWRWIDPK